MKNLLWLTLSFVLISASGYTQQDTTTHTFRKHSIHGTFGTWLFYIDGKIAYDHLFVEKKTLKQTLYLEMHNSVGISESFAYTTYFKVSPNFLLLSGNTRSHFELTTGLNFYLWDIPDSEFPSINDIVSQFTPASSLGYRFQNMFKSRFVLRTGIAWPTGLYMSAGWNF